MARYSAWAEASTDATPFAKTSEARYSIPVSNAEGNALAITIAVLSVVCIVTTAGIVLSRKRLDQ